MDEDEIENPPFGQGDEEDIELTGIERMIRRSGEELRSDL